VHGTISIGITAGGRTDYPEEEMPRRISSGVVGPFSNNSTGRLQAALYSGDVEIRANRVELLGVHPESTVISGDVRIYGNGCSLRSLSITGDVYLYGNNNDVSEAEIDGRVVSEGKNNIW
jgi:hypothetical protein